jgi:exonuclease VII small subunit
MDREKVAEELLKIARELTGGQTDVEIALEEFEKGLRAAKSAHSELKRLAKESKKGALDDGDFNKLFSAVSSVAFMFGEAKDVMSEYSRENY